MALLIFLFVGFSITNAITFLHVSHWFRILVSGFDDDDFREYSKQGKIEGFREEYLGRLVRCHACMGFWVGCFLSWYCGGFIDEYMTIRAIPDAIIADGLMLSFFNFFTWLIFRKLGAEEL